MIAGCASINKLPWCSTPGEVTAMAANALRGDSQGGNMKNGNMQERIRPCE